MRSDQHGVEAPYLVQERQRVWRGERFDHGELVVRELDMSGDAGFVSLDIVEELLQREEWEEAATIARELVDLFSAAGVTLASVNALHFLRQAVQAREATARVVRYVREYLSADDERLPFKPPTGRPS